MEEKILKEMRNMLLNMFDGDKIICKILKSENECIDLFMEKTEKICLNTNSNEKKSEYYALIQAMIEMLKEV